MGSVSRRIAREGTFRKRKTQVREVTAAGLARVTGLDLYHARIALHGTTISKSQLQTALEREQAKELEKSLGSALAGKVEAEAA